MGVDVGRHLRLQGDREHLPRSLAHDLIEHEPLASLGSASSWTTLSMGVFPTGAPTPAHDQTCYGLSIFLGKVRPFTSPAEDHPQTLIIARHPRQPAGRGLAPRPVAPDARTCEAADHR